MPEDANIRQKRLANIGEKFETLCNELSEAQANKIVMLERNIEEYKNLVSSSEELIAQLSEQNQVLTTKVEQLSHANPKP